MASSSSFNKYNCEAISQVLSTCTELEPDEVEWSSDVICQMNYDLNKLTSILVHLNRLTEIGRLSWVLHTRVVQAIKSRNAGKLVSTLNDLWPEQKIRMSDRDGLRLDQIYLSERTATLMVLESDECQRGDCSALLFPCVREVTYSTEKLNSTGQWNSHTIYQRCMEQVCLYEQHEKGNKNAFIPQNALMPNRTYILDNPHDNQRRTCYTFNQIMEMMSNPPTSTDISFISVLNSRFGVQHAMYTKAQQILNE